MTRVLMIEDNPDDVELARRAFEKVGVADQVKVTVDGEEALDYLLGRGLYAGQGTPDSVRLILLDLNLPKAPGLDVLRQIRTNAATSLIPVVVLTISRKEPDLLQSFTMGVADYLIKPIDP